MTRSGEEYIDRRKEMVAYFEDFWSQQLATISGLHLLPR